MPTGCSRNMTFLRASCVSTSRAIKDSEPRWNPHPPRASPRGKQGPRPKRSRAAKASDCHREGRGRRRRPALSARQTHAVVSTVPLSVLQAIDNGRPGARLPKGRRWAIRNLRYAAADKIGIKFKESMVGSSRARPRPRRAASRSRIVG